MSNGLTKAEVNFIEELKVQGFIRMSSKSTLERVLKEMAILGVPTQNRIDIMSRIWTTARREFNGR